MSCAHVCLGERGFVCVDVGLKVKCLVLWSNILSLGYVFFNISYGFFPVSNIEPKSIIVCEGTTTSIFYTNNIRAGTDLTQSVSAIGNKTATLSSAVIS